MYMQMVVEDADAALALLRRSCRQRQRAKTCTNAHSSRSHSIVTLHLLPRMHSPEAAPAFSFVDLAGEDQANTCDTHFLNSIFTGAYTCCAHAAITLQHVYSPKAIT